MAAPVLPTPCTSQLEHHLNTLITEIRIAQTSSDAYLSAHTVLTQNAFLHQSTWRKLQQLSRLGMVQVMAEDRWGAWVGLREAWEYRVKWRGLGRLRFRAGDAAGRARAREKVREREEAVMRGGLAEWTHRPRSGPGGWHLYNQNHH